MDPIQKLGIDTVQYLNQFRAEQLLITGRWHGDLGPADFHITVNLLHDDIYVLDWFERDTPLDDDDTSELLDVAEFQEAATVYAFKIRDRHRELMMRLVYEATSVFKEESLS